MSRKKKTQDKVKAVEVEVEVPAEVTPKKTPAPRKEAPRVQVDSRARAQEVIKPVRIALLEAHPSLPDTETILGAFAEHFRSAEERRAAARAEAEAAAQKAELDKKIASRRTVRPSWAPAMPPATGPSPRPVAPPAAAPEPAIARPDEPAPVVVEAPAPTYARVPEPDYSTAEIEAEPLALAEDEASSVVVEDDAPSIFVEDDAPPADDIFASLGQSKPAVGGDDFAFTSDYSDPFIALDKAAPPPEPDEAAALPAFDDVVHAVAEEAAPTDRTTMIQAMPDDDEGEAASEPADNGADAGKSPRKSRKSSQRRKR
ncbi:MAG: hypothetical protein IT385_17210 [Deltaproteobacteria bacterium]|nr:hypothetical protein [Deltaproteobacteria bacterium]